MTEAKHSRGPWIPERSDLTAEVVPGRTDTRGRLFLGMYSVPKDAAEAAYVILPWKWAENCTAMIARDADINLITAAPELFAALRDIQEFCDDPEGSTKSESLADGLSRLLPAARKAVAKAVQDAK